MFFFRPQRGVFLAFRSHDICIISIFLGFLSCNESNNNEGVSIDNPKKEIIVEIPKFYKNHKAI